MMRLPRFTYHTPKTIDDAVKLLAAHPGAHVVAGGTDLIPNMKRRQQTPRDVIGLRGIAALFGVRDDGGGLTIGAMTTLAELEADTRVLERYPALAHAASVVATPPIRNAATLGGNLCLDTRCNYYDQNYEWRKGIDFCMKKDGEICWVAPGSDRCWAVSSSDTAPILCALGAEVTLASTQGTRRIPVLALFNDDGIEYLAKRKDELLVAVHLPKPDGTRAVYKKLRRRGAFDFPVLGVACAIRRAATGAVEDARLFIGGAGSLPHDASALARQTLVGHPLTDDAINACAAAAAQLAKPLDNTDFQIGWRKHMARRYVADALRELAS